MTQYTAAGWKALFFLLAGLGCFNFLAGAIIFPLDPPRPLNEPRGVDWVGAVLITVGLCLLTFGLADGESAPQGVSNYPLQSHTCLLLTLHSTPSSARRTFPCFWSLDRC